MESQRRIAFSPPDITQAEIDEVVDTLKSGWITTGPKTKQFERDLATFIGAPHVAALGIGPGDEVITSAYTYTASASCICHVGATPVLVDVAPGSFEMDYDALDSAITDRTHAIIPVDIAGRMVDYDKLHAALDRAADRWNPRNGQQRVFDRLPIVTDAAHSLGAVRKGVNAGLAGDLSAFSFHAVKNLTTAEGGALTWKPGLFDDEWAYHQIMLMSLHGQTKDALAKDKAGAW